MAHGTADSIAPGADSLANGAARDSISSAAATLQRAIDRTIASGRSQHLLHATVVVLLATVLLIAALVFLARVRRALLDWIRRIAPNASPRLVVRGFALLRPEHLIRIAIPAVTALACSLGAFATYIYLIFVFTRFPWTRPFGVSLGRFLVTLLSNLGWGLLHMIPQILTAAVVFLATWGAVRAARAVFAAAEAGRIVIPGVHRETATPTRRIVTFLLWMFALVVAYPYLPGSQSPAFKGVSIFAGLLITLGSAGLVGQAMSGLVIMYARSFKIGQVVKIGDTFGTVVEMGMLATKLRTPKNEYVTLPNSVVLSGTVTNFSAPGEDGRSVFLHTSVTIGYDTPWRQVQKLLLEAARRTDDVLEEPAPRVLQLGLDDWYVEYQLNAAIDSLSAESIPTIYSRLHENIQDTFREEGVEILSPTHLALRRAEGGPPRGSSAGLPHPLSPDTRSS